MLCESDVPNGLHLMILNHAIHTYSSVRQTRRGQVDGPPLRLTSSIDLHKRNRLESTHGRISLSRVIRAGRDAVDPLVHAFAFVMGDT